MTKKSLDYSAYKDFPQRETLSDIFKNIKNIFSAKDKNKIAHKKFAADNGFSYVEETRQNNECGSLFNYGQFISMYDVIEGELDGLPFMHASYFYRDTERFGGPLRDVEFLRVSFMRFMPHLVIDSVVEADNLGFSVLPIKFDHSQKLKLEGDFNKYFNVYSPDRYAVTTLAILAPNIMEALIKEKVFCDIEIIKNHIYFYFPFSPPIKDARKNQFEMARKVLDKIGDKVVRADLFADRYQKEAHLSFAKAARPINLYKKKYLIPSSLFSTFYTTLLGVYLTRNYFADKSFLGYPLNEAKIYEKQYLIVIIFLTGVYILWKTYKFFVWINLEEKINSRYNSQIDESSRQVDEAGKELNQLYKQTNEEVTPSMLELDKISKDAQGKLIKTLDEADKALSKAGQDHSKKGGSKPTG